MKFYSSPEDLVKKLSNKEWSKYADSPIDVPTEQVEEIKRIAREKAGKLRDQAEMAKSKGDISLYEKKLDEAKALENIEKNVRDSGVTRKEAIEARVSPNKFVAKEVLKESHAAGKNAAKGAAILPGVGTTVGAVVGSMVGYTVSNLIYDECLNVLKRRDISMERRRIIEEISVEAIKKLEVYRYKLIEENNMILKERDLIIEDISISIKSSNLDMLTESINKLGKTFKKNLQFQTFEEFDDVMNDENLNIIL